MAGGALLGTATAREIEAQARVERATRGMPSPKIRDVQVIATAPAGLRLTVVKIVTDFGEKVGVAFQLADDVIDLSADGAETGKMPGTDLRERVPTMPVLLLRARAARPDARTLDRDLVALLDSDLSGDADLARAVRGLRGHDVVAETRALAAAWAREAVAELDPLPAGPVKDALLSFAAALVDRAS